MKFIVVIIFSIAIQLSHQDDCGVGWTAYSDQKCFQIINTKATEAQAKTMCAQLDSSATLLTIGSANEQAFINTLLPDSVLVYNYWLGLEWVSNAWKWVDGSGLTYTNWDLNAGKGTKGCAKISTVLLNNQGKWNDDSCTGQNFVICQKISPLYKLSKKFDNLTSVVDQQQAKLQDQQSQINQLKTQGQTQQGQIQALQTQGTNQQAQIQAIQSQNANQQSQIDKQQGDIQTLKSQGQTQQAQIQAQQTQNTNQQAQIDGLTKQATGQQGQLDQQQGAIKSLQNQSADQLGQIQAQQGQIGDLQNQLKSEQDEIAKQQGEIDALIPIGFIYTQLSGQSSPQDIWPTYQWQEITEQYAGLFFRAEGTNNGSAAFGQVQGENAPGRMIDEVQNSFGTGMDACAFGTECSLNPEGWSDWYFTGRNYGQENAYIRFHSRNNTEEVRPRNMAMKIWQRVNPSPKQE